MSNEPVANIGALLVIAAVLYITWPVLAIIGGVTLVALVITALVTRNNRRN